MKLESLNNRNQSGQILLLAIIVISVVLLNSILLIGGSQLFSASSDRSVDSAQALSLAEAGLDKALASLDKTGGTYSGETETVFGEGAYDVAITTNGTEKIVQSTGYIPSKTNPRFKKTVKITASKGEGASFNYGVQVGDGGLVMNNSNIIRGSVYSNADIIGTNANQILGDVWVAGGTAPTANQSTDCTSGCGDYVFGKVTNGALDVAQSFKPNQTQVINKVSLKLKKVGAPVDINVRIMANTGTEPTNKPDKNNIIATGILLSNLVSTNYSWVDVTFTTSPTLTSGTIYWIMLDTSANSTNYWAWQNDNVAGYTCAGSVCYAKWSADYTNGSNPIWTNATGDLAFKVFMGGVVTKLDGGAGINISGNVHANTIKNATIQKDAFYQTLLTSTVVGVKHPGSADPPPQNFQISDGNITDWKDSAATAGNLSAPDCNVSTVWGPGKYTGNVSFGNACKENIKSPIWITGTLTFVNANELKVDSSMGSATGIVLVDGRVIFNNSTKLSGSGSVGSYLMMITLYDSRTNGISAMDINNGIDGGILYADKGLLNINNGNKFKEMTAWKIFLNNGIELTYETGLSGVFFESGPSGSYSFIKGTYQIK